jgi:diaminopimelate decarboxylase
MDHFNYHNGVLCAEQVPLDAIADQYGTPCYIYSRATIERHWHAFNDAFTSQPHLVCYAVKANSNLAVLNVLARMGSGFDIVSGGELARVLKAGGKAANVVFSGVGKTEEEIELALNARIRCFNIESEPELERVAAVASRMQLSAPVSLRVNPDVDAGTHPYISTGLKENKFGINIDDAMRLYEKAAAYDSIEVTGMDCHIGSQLTSIDPFLDALDRLLVLIDKLDSKGIHIQHLDIGGGLGIRYQDEAPPEPASYAEAIAHKLKGRNLEVLMEPGRAIMGNAGVLLTKVEYVKTTEHKNFAIVDAAMNDLIRPALYDAWQAIIPVQEQSGNKKLSYDIVGPVCETGDFLGKNRELAIAEGDLLAVRSAGAYGYAMSSNYNSRPRVAEIMVDGDQSYLIRRRESYDDLFHHECLLPED